MSVLLYAPQIVFGSLLGLALMLVAVYWYIEVSRKIRMADKLPGPKRLPILGNFLLVNGIPPKELFKKVLEHDIYGPVIRATLLHEVVIFLYDPRDVELILSNPRHNDKSAEYKYFQPWLGDGLLVSTGDKWRTHRKIIAPTFHLNVLKSFVPLFYEHSRALVVRLKNQIGKEIDCHDYFIEHTVKVLMETAMGVKSSEKGKSSHDYGIAAMEMCDIIHRRQYNILLRSDLTFQFTDTARKQKELLNTIHSFANGVIQVKKNQVYQDICNELVEKRTSENVQIDSLAEMKAKKEDSKENAGIANDAAKEPSTMKMHYVQDDLDDMEDNDVGEKKRLAFLDLMLALSRSGVQLTEQEIVDEVNTIMFEQQAYEEIEGIFGGSDRQCTFQDTIEMKYLDRVIFEALRLFPPVPLIARRVNEDVTLASQNGVIPRGATVAIPILKIHRLETYYPNPMKFNPDNFLPEKMQARHYYSYIPFSAGPRSCVGRKYAMLKLKILISTILRNYKVYSDLTEEEINLQVDIILKRSDGFKVTLEPRDKTSCCA